MVTTLKPLRLELYLEILVVTLHFFTQIEPISFIEVKKDENDFSYTRWAKLFKKKRCLGTNL